MIDKDSKEISTLVGVSRIVGYLSTTYVGSDSVKKVFDTKPSHENRETVEEVLKVNDFPKPSIQLQSLRDMIEGLTDDIKNDQALAESLDISLHRNEPNEYEIKAFLSIEQRDFHEFKHVFGRVRKHIRYNKMTLLQQAIVHENYEFVKYLIENEVDLNVVDDIGRNPLQIALLTTSDERIIELLINKGFDLPVLNLNNHEPDVSGSTRLHYIAATGDLKKLQQFAKLNSDSNFYKTEDRKGINCIERAVFNGHLYMLIEMLKLFKIELTYNNTIKYVLRYALLFGNNAQLLKWLFKNISGIVSHSLHFVGSVGGRSTETVIQKLDILRARGASLNNDDWDGNNNNFLMVYITDSRSSFTAPVDEKLFEYLRENGISLQHINNKNQSICHIAAANGQLKLLKMIREEIPSQLFYSLDETNSTPIMYAIKNGHLDVVKYLLDMIKHDTEYVSATTDGNDLTLLDLALLNGYYVIADFLKQSGFVVSSLSQHFEAINKEQFINDYQMHPIALANLASIEIFASSTASQIIIIKSIKHLRIQTFLEYKIPFEKYLNSYGTNILHLAACFGRNDIVIWLYLKGYPPLSRADNFGYTALAYASINGHFSTVLLLQLLGVDSLFKNATVAYWHHVRNRIESKQFQLAPFLVELSICLETLNATLTMLTHEENEKFKKIIDSINVF